MLKRQSSCIAWLWLLPLICTGTIHFSILKKSPVVQEGDVRLAGASRPSEGRVEIYHDGQWGTVCDDGWDLKEAQVVCRQLKFPGAVSVVTEEIYGKASGPIWMDDMECSGTEKYLHACKFKGWGISDCSHKEDVSVICQTGGKDTGAEGSLPDSPHIVDNRIVLSGEMEELFNSGAFCDLSITAQSPYTNDQAGTEQTETMTLCAHKAILSRVPGFNITDDTRNITVEVVQRCLSYFSSFVRYLYTRRIDVTFSSVQCLHWLSSSFGEEQLMRDTGLLFNELLPEDSSFETPVSVHEYAVETKDLVLQEICVQFMVWNFQNFSQSPAWTHISVDLLISLLVRSDLVVQDELFVLKAVENWILSNADINVDTQAKVLSLVRFPMIPAEHLTSTYMLANSALYSTHRSVFDENMLKALQFNMQLYTNLQSNEKMLVDDVCFQPRLYTEWSTSFPLPSNDSRYEIQNPNMHGLQYQSQRNSDIFVSRFQSRRTALSSSSFSGYDSIQTKYIYSPYHSSLIFQGRKINWAADLFSTQTQCFNRGVRCPTLPMARLNGHDSNSPPGIVFHNRLLLMCNSQYVSQVLDFKNNVVYLVKNTTQTYPCRHDRYSLVFVVRPEFL